MKKISFIALPALAALALGLFAGGCATKSTTVPGSTNVVTQIDPQTLADSAIILRNAARNASAIAIEKNPDNKKYINLSVATLDTFLIGNDYTPGALTEALKPVIKQVNDVKISLAINTVTDLYEIFYGRYVKSQIANNPTAVLFITALRDGASQGLDATASNTSLTK